MFFVSHNLFIIRGIKNDDGFSKNSVSIRAKAIQLSR